MNKEEMDNFEKRLYLNNLYDIYRELLTEKQKMYFQEFLFLFYSFY